MSDGLYHDRYVRPGEHQGLAGNPNDSLIRPTTSRGRQLVNRLRRDVPPNDGEVAGLEFEDVGAPLEAGGLRTVGVRIGAKSFLNMTDT